MSSSFGSSSGSPSPEPETSVLSKRKRKDVAVNKVEADNSESDSSSSDSSDSEAEPTPDEPVLSHAERRRQKKAKKLVEKEKDLSPTKKRKLENGRAVPVPASKRQNSVWVGNMAYKTTQENLRTFFKDAGEIIRIYMPTKPTTNPAMKPENHGYAYVDFSSLEGKTAAIGLSEHPLIGRKLLIKDGDDFAGRPTVAGGESQTAGSVTHSKTAQKILRAQKQPPAPTLFMGNLGFEATEQDIRQMLEVHRSKTAKKTKAKMDDGAASEEEGGPKNKPTDIWLRKVRMGTFEDSGKCKGFAFIDFTTIEHATAALINPKNHQLNGRKLVVEYAGADAVRRGAPKAKREEGSALPMKRDGPPRTKRPERSERMPRPKTFRSAEEEPSEKDAAPASSERWKSGSQKEERDTKTVGEGKREKGPRSRPKPGAALALAKRESAAIVPSKGQKITF